MSLTPPRAWSSPGLGVALLPRTSVVDQLASGRLRSIELVGAPPVERRIVAVRRRERGETSPAALAFWSLLGAVSERR